jgi:uroporphyrinogen III methyltransferase/synthase
MGGARVFLVGAGPGDPGLLTVRGRELLESAEVVVYDLLADPGLLDLAPPSARRINAGKRAGRAVRTQDQTNALLVRLGRRHTRVVRLKGGDPFVFGRGGEEALALEAAAIPFEIVPGVSSGVAAPAYAGIPVTHRGLAQAVVFATGRGSDGRPPKPAQLKALAALDATLVFFMAIGTFREVAKALIRAGKPAATPAAAVYGGTRPGQKTLRGTLGGLAEAMAAAETGDAPGLVLVGPVAGLSGRLAWFERRPLFGRRYLVTRAREQAGPLSRALRAAGAEVVELPLARIEALPLDASMRRAFAGLARTGWVVFTSANGVDHFFARLAEAGLDTRALAGCAVAAIGPATAAALGAHGVRADLVPKAADSDGLWKELKPELARLGRRRGLLLARAQEGRDVLVAGAKRLGVRVTDLAVYRNVPAPARTRAALAAEIEAGRLDGVVFTSASGVSRLVGLFTDSRWRRVSPKVRALCLGPVTREAALAAGLEVGLTAASPDTASFVGELTAVDGHGSPEERA